MHATPEHLKLPPAQWPFASHVYSGLPDSSNPGLQV
eukprot:COSAG01_NODE_68703_length_263_cov_0.920732_1_plen_35_part_10